MSNNSPTRDISKSDNLHYIADIDDIDEGEQLLTEIRGRQIGVYNLNGEFYALANYCTHQGGPLCEGLVSGTLDVDESYELTYSRDGEIVSCPWHGWEFDIKTGKHLAREEYRVPAYKVVQKEGSLYVMF